MKTRVVVSDFSAIEGGATAVATDHAIKLSKMNYKVIYLSGGQDVDKALIENDIQVISVYGDHYNKAVYKALLPIKFIWNYSAYVKIRKILKQIPKDDSKFYIHSWTKRISSSLFFAIRGNKYDITIIAHDYFLECPNGGYFNYRKNRSCSLTPLSFSCFLTQCDKRNSFEKYARLFRAVVQKIALLKVDFKICYVSDYQRRVMRTPFIINKEFTILPNIVKKSSNTRILAENNSDIVFVGRFDKEKGIYNLLNALKKANIQAVFVGGGVLTDVIHNSGIASHVYEWIDREGVGKILKESRFIVIPSLWHEADPLISIEAASIGLPRVVSKYCALEDTVIDRETGFVIDPIETDDFSKLLSDLLINDELIKKVSISTFKCANNEIDKREKINKDFSW